jgi:hypothetical protein
MTLCTFSSITTFVVQAAIDLDDLLHPARALAMLEVQDLVVRPMKVIRQIRYLFVEPLYGVAPNPPAGLSSTMNGLSQCGHCAWIWSWPCWFTR